MFISGIREYKLKLYEMKKLSKIFWISAIVVFISSCVSLKIWLDKSSMQDISQMILDDTQDESAAELEKYLDNNHQENIRQAFPLNRIKIKPLTQWRLDGVSVQQEISFPSTLKRKNGEPDTAIFYLYSKNGIKGQNVIL